MSTTYGKYGHFNISYTQPEEAQVGRGAPRLHTEDAEDEDKTPHDWEGYIDRVAGSCDCLSG